MASPVADSFTAASGNVIFAGKSGSVAATGVTVLDYLDMTVFQRRGTTKLILLSGTCTGSPSLLQWRIIDFTSGTPITSWTTLITNPDPSFSAYANIPQGCWYKVQVRCAIDNTKIATTSNRLGVGVIIVELGQSNMANFGTTSSSGYKYPLGDPKAVEFYTTTNIYRRISTYNDTFAPNTLFGGTGGWSSGTSSGVSSDGYVYVANLVSEGLNLPVAVINKAVSGSSIAAWTSTPTYWNAFVASLKLMGGDFEVALWFQGETEASTGTSTASYKASLAVLHRQMKGVTGRGTSDLHFGIISLGPQGIASSFSGSSDLKVGAIRAAQVQYAQENAGAFYVTSALDTQTASDMVHIVGNTDGHSKLGRRYAKSVLAQLGVGTTAAGPIINSGARTGLNIDLAVTHTGGTTLADGIGGTGTGLTGFRIFDDGAAGALIAYTTSITSATNVRLTMTTTPVGPLRVDYAMTNSPHSSDTTVSNTTPVYSTILYDNAYYHNGANASPFGLTNIGSPLQPFAPINIIG